jgi:hypothetical protein
VSFELFPLLYQVLLTLLQKLFQRLRHRQHHPQLHHLQLDQLGLDLWRDLRAARDRVRARQLHRPADHDLGVERRGGLADGCCHHDDGYGYRVDVAVDVRIFGGLGVEEKKVGIDLASLFLLVHGIVAFRPCVLSCAHCPTLVSRDGRIAFRPESMRLRPLGVHCASRYY